MTSQPIWQPSPADIEHSQLTAFTRLAEQRSGREFADYQQLHDWSLSDAEAFWTLVWEFTGVIASQRASKPSEGYPEFPGTRWFPGARLNFAENLLRHDDDQPALISVLEGDPANGPVRSLSYSQLRGQVASVADYLRAVGVEPGDRVAGWLSNVPEAIVAMLATASLGAVWSSCSPDFGARGALDRFGQIGPKVLFAVDGYSYNGTILPIVDKVIDVVDQVEAIQSIVWIEQIGARPDDGARFEQLLVTDPPPLNFVQRAFDDPLYILYSSGTTGKPKCIVHGIGGTLLQHLKEHQLHTNLCRRDKLFFFTTCGWMMWNWLVSGLATGATLVLYEGSPTYPTPATLFDVAERLGVTVFGTSARFLSSIEKAGLVPRETHDLTSLRALLSTGSVLTQEGFNYVYRQIKPDLHLASISGGTDIVSCFVLGNPNAPVWEGEIQAAGLGMAVDVVDDQGQSVREAKGELVCRQPFPACPIGFWNDPSGDAFLNAYFRRFPGIWTHGDFAQTTNHGGFIIHGRSDTVLNPGGVRIGTAEIYRQVDQLDVIQESVCVSQDWDGDVRVVLFVVMKPGVEFTESVQAAIRQNIRAYASPRHVPQIVLEVPDIPRTMSGKIVELAVREVIHGREVQNATALINPQALEYFRNRDELNR